MSHTNMKLYLPNLRSHPDSRSLQETQLDASSLVLENPRLTDDWVRGIEDACMALGSYETVCCLQ
jgi:hypothetical protein